MFGGDLQNDLFKLKHFLKTKHEQRPNTTFSRNYEKAGYD